VLFVYLTPVPFEYKGSWHTQPVLMLCRGEKYLPLPRIEPIFSSCPFCSLVTVVTELFWPVIVILTAMCYSELILCDDTACHKSCKQALGCSLCLCRGADCVCAGMQLVSVQVCRFLWTEKMQNLILEIILVICPPQKLNPTLVIVGYTCFFHYLKARIRE